VGVLAACCELSQRRKCSQCLFLAEMLGCAVCLEEPWDCRALPDSNTNTDSITTKFMAKPSKFIVLPYRRPILVVDSPCTCCACLTCFGRLLQPWHFLVSRCGSWTVADIGTAWKLAARDTRSATVTLPLSGKEEGQVVPLITFAVNAVVCVHPCSITDDFSSLSSTTLNGFIRDCRRVLALTNDEYRRYERF
jgi:hypothetical protein